MNVTDVLDNLAQDLNDFAPGYSYVTWTKEQLRGYLYEALALIASERPELFAENKVVKLEPCVTWHTACDCTKITKVLGQSTVEGRIIKDLKRRDDSGKNLWTGRECPANPNNFSLSEYSIDTETNSFRVYPQPIPGQDTYVMVQCAVVPDAYSDGADIPNSVLAAANQWALYRAKSVDGENNQLVLQSARDHKES